MRRIAAIAAGTLAVGCSVAAASATSGHVVQLKDGGRLALAGSSIGCGSGIDVKHVTLIDCEIDDSSGYPKHGSYIVLMEADGRVNVTNETTLKTVFDRTPASARRAGATPQIHAGDTIQLPGTPSISCGATLVLGKPTINCYFVDKGGVVRPHSYSFALGNTLVTVFAWDAKRHLTVVKSWPENG